MAIEILEVTAPSMKEQIVDITVIGGMFLIPSPFQQ
jgi:hypothetical protein